MNLNERLGDEHHLAPAFAGGPTVNPSEHSDEGPYHISELLPAVLLRYDLHDTPTPPLPAPNLAEVVLTPAH